jgi:hypothetical protein
MRLVRASILLTALLGAVAALLAGCGGDEDAGTSTTAPATTAAAPAVTTPAGPPTVLTATLTAAASVPKGPAGATGSVRITLRPDTGKACWTLTVRGLDKGVSAHVHEAPRGKLGPVVIPLGDRFARKGCVLSTPRALRTVVRRPGAHYVDVHTVKHLDGALRGPLRASSG